MNKKVKESHAYVDKKHKIIAIVYGIIIAILSFCLGKPYLMGCLLFLFPVHLAFKMIKNQLSFEIEAGMLE